MEIFNGPGLRKDAKREFLPTGLTYFVSLNNSVMKLFEVIIEGRENGESFFIMYHVQARTVRQVPAIIRDTASAANFELVRIEETNYLHDVEDDQTRVVSIMRMSPALMR